MAAEVSGRGQGKGSCNIATAGFEIIMTNTRLLPLVASILISLLVGGCASSRNGTGPGFQKISAKSAARFAPYAMMAANSYHGEKNERFPIEALGWRQIDLNGKPNNTVPTYRLGEGLAYDIFKKDRENTYVFAFRGTDSWVDFFTANLSVGYSWQYGSASKHFARFVREHPTARIVATGHSLGGGLALHVSVRAKEERRRPVDAIAFDSSPRIFDGLGNKHLEGRREMVYQKGEVLIIPRRIITKVSDVVPRENIYETNYPFGTTAIKRHSSQHLAKELLLTGAAVDPELRRVARRLPSQLAKIDTRPKG
jgi:hypothetical protein